MKHHWYHFIYGKKWVSETIKQGKNYEITNGWEVCRKCEKQLTEKTGFTHFGPFEMTIDKHSNQQTK